MLYFEVNVAAKYILTYLYSRTNQLEMKDVCFVDGDREEIGD